MPLRLNRERIDDIVAHLAARAHPPHMIKRALVDLYPEDREFIMSWVSMTEGMTDTMEHWCWETPSMGTPH